MRQNDLKEVGSPLAHVNEDFDSPSKKVLLVQRTVKKAKKVCCGLLTHEILEEVG